jgi:hypothetical protein
MAEAIVGDIPATAAISKADKHAAEAAAMQHMCGILAPTHPRAAARLAALYAEYEAGATPEAQAVKDIDKCEMILQALEYEEAAAAAAAAAVGHSAAREAGARGSHGQAQGRPGCKQLDLSDFYASVDGRIKSSAVGGWAAEVVARRQALLAGQTAPVRRESAAAPWQHRPGQRGGSWLQAAGGGAALVAAFAAGAVAAWAIAAARGARS